MFVPSPPASLKVACAHDTVRSPARVVNLRSNRLLPKQQHAVHHICTCHMQQRRCSMLAAASLADAPSTSGTHTGGIATRVATFALSLSIAASSAFGWWAPVAHAASETGAKAIAEYVELQHKGKLNSNKQIDDFRQKYNIRRTFDGRVQVGCEIHLALIGSCRFHFSKICFSRFDFAYAITFQFLLLYALAYRPWQLL